MICGVAGRRLAPGRWALVVSLQLASAMPYALIGFGFGFGMRLGGKDAVAMATALFLASAVVSGLWMPSSLLPIWLRAVGEAARPIISARSDAPRRVT